MVEINTDKPDPVYRSYSSFTKFLKCPMQWKLSKIVKVAEVPAWYFIGGDAFHKTAEDYDRARWKDGRR